MSPFEHETLASRPRPGTLRPIADGSRRLEGREGMQTDRSDYVSGRQAAVTLGVSWNRWTMIRGEIPVRRWELPGVPPRYHRGDLLKLARGAFKEPAAEPATA